MDSISRSMRMRFGGSIPYLQPMRASSKTQFTTGFSCLWHTEGGNTAIFRSTYFDFSAEEICYPCIDLCITTLEQISCMNVVILSYLIWLCTT